MKLVVTDGGRAAAGFKGITGDCVVRSIAIASGRPYREVYDAITKLAKGEKFAKKKGCQKRGSIASDGVWRETYERYLKSIGAKWIPLVTVGSSKTVRLRASDLPNGRIICSLKRHLVAVVDGVLHDLDDCSREGTRRVYGYYKIKERS